MFKKVGCLDVLISSDKGAIAEADKLLLPGVGNFDYGMQQLKNSGFLDTLSDKVLNNNTPLLGICLGAQMLTKSSEEGKEPGLGWINGTTIKFDKSKLSKKLKIPHMGWTDVTIEKPSKLFTNMDSVSRFYFVHSYHMKLDRVEDELNRSTYGYSFVSGFEDKNIIGVQFHPEKSHKYGMNLLKNFVEYY
jgi:imidazole glycerol-phosphate synthase subunit HisH